MLFRLYQMLLVYTPFKVGPSRPAWDRGREQRRSSKPDWMNSGSSISINKEVDQGNKRWFSDCSRRGKFLSTNKHDHTSLHPCRKVPHCWIFFAKSCGKERIIMTAVVSALCAFVWLSPTLSQTDTQTCSSLYIHGRPGAESWTHTLHTIIASGLQTSAQKVAAQKSPKNNKIPFFM